MSEIFTKFEEFSDAERFYKLFTTLCNEYVPKTEKPFNYKFIQRNELISSGTLELPPIDLESKVLGKSIGVMLLTEAVRGNMNILKKPFKDPKQFVVKERYEATKSNNNAFLFNFAFYMGNGYILTVFDIEPQHALFPFCAENFYKVSHICFEAVYFGLLHAKLLYYESSETHYTLLFFTSVSTFFFPLAKFVAESYGLVTAEKMYKYYKRRARKIKAPKEEVA